MLIAADVDVVLLLVWIARQGQQLTEISQQQLFLGGVSQAEEEMHMVVSLLEVTARMSFEVNNEREIARDTKLMLGTICAIPPFFTGEI
jgi:hypothetical protein